MTEKVKTVIECYFLLPDFKSRGHPTGGATMSRAQNRAQIHFNLETRTPTEPWVSAPVIYRL